MTHKQRSCKDFSRVVIALPGLRLVGFTILGIKNWFAITNVYDAVKEEKNEYSSWVERQFHNAPKVLKGSARLLHLEDYRLVIG